MSLDQPCSHRAHRCRRDAPIPLAAKLIHLPAHGAGIRPKRQCRAIDTQTPVGQNAIHQPPSRPRFTAVPADAMPHQPSFGNQLLVAKKPLDPPGERRRRRWRRCAGVPRPGKLVRHRQKLSARANGAGRNLQPASPRVRFQLRKDPRPIPHVLRPQWDRPPRYLVQQGRRDPSAGDRNRHNAHHLVVDPPHLPQRRRRLRVAKHRTQPSQQMYADGLAIGAEMLFSLMMLVGLAALAATPGVSSVTANPPDR